MYDVSYFFILDTQGTDVYFTADESFDMAELQRRVEQVTAVLASQYRSVITKTMFFLDENSRRSEIVTTCWRRSTPKDPPPQWRAVKSWTEESWHCCWAHVCEVSFSSANLPCDRSFLKPCWYLYFLSPLDIIIITVWVENKSLHFHSITRYYSVEKHMLKSCFSLIFPRPMASLHLYVYLSFVFFISRVFGPRLTWKEKKAFTYLFAEAFLFNSFRH